MATRMTDSVFATPDRFAFDPATETDLGRARQALELVGEVVAGARKTEAESAAASSTASTVVMNVRMVEGMMGEMVRGIAEVKGCIQQSQDAAGRALAQSGQTRERIEMLTGAVEQIAATAKLINKIAQKTNMLSLNATIEAARAGQGGRGFAVVAGEVQALSEQTKRATEEINQQLRSIREANTELAGSVEAINLDFTAVQKAVAGATGAIRDYDSSLTTITRYAGEAANSVEGIAALLDSTAATAHAMVEKFRHLEQGSVSGPN